MIIFLCSEIITFIDSMVGIFFISTTFVSIKRYSLDSLFESKTFDYPFNHLILFENLKSGGCLSHWSTWLVNHGV